LNFVKKNVIIIYKLPAGLSCDHEGSTGRSANLPNTSRKNTVGLNL